MSDLENAMEAATLAVRFDQMKEVDKAVECYRTAARLLDRVRDGLPPDKQSELQTKVREYLERATLLLEQERGLGRLQGVGEGSERGVRECGFMLQQALDADQAGLTDLALQLYTSAVERAITIKTSDPKINNKIKNIAEQALDRAEELKGLKKMEGLSLNEVKRPPATPHRAQLQREQSVQLKVSGQAAYSDEEKEVLRLTSRINKLTFLPWLDVDLAERFQLALPFTDREGPLPLSGKQRAELDRWVRPHEVFAEPTLIAGDHPDCYSIKQTIVSDCSLVASLAVSALYEQRFNKRLVSSIVYPKNKHKQPVYNPFGKYMVKLHLNGVRRKVIIGDQLPWSVRGRLLCSYSATAGELWVSLLEKAYMKVMGGYDFPGSNSNIDLHALTGWIPERVALRASEADFNAGALFDTVRTRLARGDVLATVATGALDRAQEERTGLVATHAYAVLDVVTHEGVRLLKLKNPWSHVRWRGNYSELDTAHWTPQLRAALHYDPDSAAQYDNGVFWIDYNSILNFFDVFYLNWNPALFDYTYCIHQQWEAGTGPMKDLYNIGDNPQYSLHAHRAGAVWLLLTRHITHIDDFRDNQEYITLLVYNTQGRRVYYPNDPPPYIDGVRINSPHYLVKVICSGEARYSLVVSQYEKTRTIYYTLRAYASCPFTLDKIQPYVYTYTCEGAWSGRSAGGCENHRATYPHNPRYWLTVTRTTTDVTLQLKGPKAYQLGMDVRVESLEDPSQTAPFLKHSSGPYRSGFVVVELPPLPAGRYSVLVSTFLPAQEGPFLLEARATHPLTLHAAQ